MDARHRAHGFLQINKSINVGVAAHITAAAPGGPRFDPNLTQQERRAAQNGIWLCQNCAKLVDSDSARYTVETLRTWKQQAEDRALRQIEHAIPPHEKQGDRVPSSEPSYSVTGGIGPDIQDPPPGTLYTKALPNGDVAEYMVRDGKLMSEVTFEDGKTLAQDMTAEGITINSLPVPLEQMTVEVDPAYIWSDKRFPQRDGRTLWVRKGKWGLQVMVMLNPNGTMHSFNIVNGEAIFHKPFTTIVVKPRIKRA